MIQERLQNQNSVKAMVQTLSRIALSVRYLCATIVLLFAIGIGNAWGSATYKYQLKTVTQNNTGYGKVYATATAGAPAYSSYYASNTNAYSAVTASSGSYYLWAVPTQRGVTFNNWTTSSS